MLVGFPSSVSTPLAPPSPEISSNILRSSSSASARLDAFFGVFATFGAFVGCAMQDVCVSVQKSTHRWDRSTNVQLC